MAHLKQDPQSICDLTGPMTQIERNTVGVDAHSTAVSQYMMVDRKAQDRTAQDRTQVRTIGVTNSSRWTDVETRNLLDIWGKRYSSLRFKKRNFKEWEMIAREFNIRCQMNGSSGLGPRTGAQCKIRIKNIVSDYKKTKQGEGPAQNSKHTFPFFDTIESIITRGDQQDASPVNGEVKQGEDVTLQLPVHAIGRQHVSLTSTGMVVSPVNTARPGPSISTDTTHVNTARPGPSISTDTAHVNTARPGPSISTDTTHINTARPGPSISTDTTHVPTNHLPPTTLHNSGMETQCFETSPNHQKASSHHVCNVQHKSALVQKRKLRKNPRPVKVVKVTRQVNKDDRLLAVVREFMEERRKREEELFDKLFQQQAEAEKRYQEFTLNVIREIGRLFRPEAFGNSS